MFGGAGNEDVNIIIIRSREFLLLISSGCLSTNLQVFLTVLSSIMSGIKSLHYNHVSVCRKKVLPLQRLLGQSPSGTQSLRDPVESVSDEETRSPSLRAENAGYVSAEQKSQTFYGALLLFLKYQQ